GDDTILTLTRGNPIDFAVNGPTARHSFGVDGSGITIGVISDSFNSLGGAGHDIAIGALPNAISILSDVAGSDEGRAIAQIIDALAPGAAIDFYSGINGPEDLASGIAALQAAGCQIIVDDLGFYERELVGGVTDQAIDAAVAAGVTYVTAGGNDRAHGIPV